MTESCRIMASWNLNPIHVSGIEWLYCRLPGMLAYMSDVTQILSKIEYGDPSAAEQLLPLIYDELRSLASAKMSDESPGNTLQATALVHEAYIRLVDVDQAQHWNSRGHFFGAAAEAMRRIIVEQARRKASLRMGGDWNRQDVPLDEYLPPESPEQVVAVHEALLKLAGVNSMAARLVNLRYFAGLSVEEASSALGHGSRLRSGASLIGSPSSSQNPALRCSIKPNAAGTLQYRSNRSGTFAAFGIVKFTRSAANVAFTSIRCS
jgi:RNA polymerase sigma factor (TIGR02999 family)